MKTTTAMKSYEEIRDEAKLLGWTAKQIKAELFANNLKDRKEEMLAELGISKGPAQTESPKSNDEIHAETKAAVERIEAEFRAKAAAEKAAVGAKAAQLIAAKAAITDGAVIWCDAADNKNGRYHNGCRIGLRVDTEAGRFTAQHYNTKTFSEKTGAYDQFAAECYGVLKAVELALECKLTTCVIRNDRIGGFESSTRRGYIGAKYLWVAKKMAAENNLEVEFDRCTGQENLADAVSRRSS